MIQDQYKLVFRELGTLQTVTRATPSGLWNIYPHIHGITSPLFLLEHNESIERNVKQNP
jgi:hypothetical protein